MKYNYRGLFKMRAIINFFCLALFVALSTGCVIQPVPSGPERVNAAPTGTEAMRIDVGDTLGAYALRPSDPLYIRFSGIHDQLPLDIEIDANGEISLLHLKPLHAAGLTTTALESKIERAYIDGGIYRNVSVNVTMTAKTFYIQGEVNSPGQFPLSSGTTLMQAIMGARGYNAFAWKTKVTITRQKKVYIFNMKDIAKDPSKDVRIEAGDMINIPQKPW